MGPTSDRRFPPRIDDNLPYMFFTDVGCLEHWRVLADGFSRNFANTGMKCFFFKDDSNNDMGTIKNQTVKFHPRSCDYNGPTLSWNLPQALSAQTFSMRAKVGGKRVTWKSGHREKKEKSPQKGNQRWGYGTIFQGRTGCFFSFLGEGPMGYIKNESPWSHGKCLAKSMASIFKSEFLGSHD